MPDVVKVRHLGRYRIYVEFEDGVAGEVDLGKRFSFEGVFEPLKDENEFAKVGLGLGTIVWPTGADICPDVLYSLVTGKPIPWATAEDGGSREAKVPK